MKDSKNPDELSAYLEQYPKGLYAPLARVRLKALTEAKPPPAAVATTAPLPSWPSVPLNVASLPFLSDGTKATLDDARADALNNCQKANQRHPCIIAAINDGSVVQASYSTQSVRDVAIEMIRRVSLEMDFYGSEDKDAGIAPAKTRKPFPWHSATPRSHPTAKTITTRQLIDLYRAAKPPAMINVLDWTEGAFALPGTSWIHGMGKMSPSPGELTKLRLLLAQVAPDTASPLVVYCLSWECWMSYNAALTAREIGYTNVYWYRGGTTAWGQAKLPVVRTKLLKDL